MFYEIEANLFHIKIVIMELHTATLTIIAAAAG